MCINPPPELLTIMELIRDTWSLWHHGRLFGRLGPSNFTADGNETPQGLPTSSEGTALRQLEPAKSFVELSILECNSNQ
jgi:hypothetical protein